MKPYKLTCAAIILILVLASTGNAQTTFTDNPFVYGFVVSTPVQAGAPMATSALFVVTHAFNPGSRLTAVTQNNTVLADGIIDPPDHTSGRRSYHGRSAYQLGQVLSPGTVITVTLALNGGATYSMKTGQFVTNAVQSADLQTLTINGKFNTGTPTFVFAGQNPIPVSDRAITLTENAITIDLTQDILGYSGVDGQYSFTVRNGSVCDTVIVPFKSLLPAPKN